VTVALTFGEVNLSRSRRGFPNAAQLLIGCSLGSGFEARVLRTSPRFIGMVCLSVALAMLGSALCAWGLAVLGSVPVATMVLATAPGGMAEMCVTAKVLQLGVPLVYSGPRHASDYSCDHDGPHVPAGETAAAQLADVNGRIIS